MFPKCFLKIAREPNNYQFYLPKFLKFCENILHKLLGPSQCLEKFIEVLEWSTLQKQIRPLPPYSILQHIEGVATPKLAPINCLWYLQTTLIIGEGGWSRIYVRYWELAFYIKDLLSFIVSIFLMFRWCFQSDVVVAFGLIHFKNLYFPDWWKSSQW